MKANTKSELVFTIGSHLSFLWNGPQRAFAWLLLYMITHIPHLLHHPRLVVILANISQNNYLNISEKFNICRKWLGFNNENSFLLDISPTELHKTTTLCNCSLNQCPQVPLIKACPFCKYSRYETIQCCTIHEGVTHQTDGLPGQTPGIKLAPDWPLRASPLLATGVRIGYILRHRSWMWQT